MPLDTRAMDGALGVTDRPGISAARSGPMDAVQSSLTAADVLADEVRALVDDLLGPRSGKGFWREHRTLQR